VGWAARAARGLLLGTLPWPVDGGASKLQGRPAFAPHRATRTGGLISAQMPDDTLNYYELNGNRRLVASAGRTLETLCGASSPDREPAVVSAWRRPG